MEACTDVVSLQEIVTSKRKADSFQIVKMMVAHYRTVSIEVQKVVAKLWQASSMDTVKFQIL